MAFDILRVDVPLNDLRDARKVWNHIDELRVDAKHVAYLSRNGLRIGAGKNASWPAIRAILDTPQVEMRKEQLVAQQGQPLSIQLAAIGESESIFIYGRNNRLAGKTFPAGDKLLNIDYNFHPGTHGGTEVRIGLEVRLDLGMMTWERHGDGIREVPAVDRHIFESLTTTITIGPGEFLVVGLGEHAANEYLIGNRFLTRESGGDRFETLLFITPQPFQTQPSRKRRS